MIEEFTTKLRQLTHLNILHSWQCCFQEVNPLAINQYQWLLPTYDDSDHITWEAGRKVIWLAQQLTIPPDLNGYPLSGLSLRLALSWWVDLAQVYLDGKLLQEGDLFESSIRVLITPDVIPGQTFTIAIRLVSPGHDTGAFLKSLCIYEKETIDPGFVADELSLLYLRLQASLPEAIPLVEKQLASFDWYQVDESLETLRHHLISITQQLPQYQFNILTHAHLDMAWLWEVDETWQAAENTFNSVLKLQQDFPHLTFGHSTSALYAWIEEHRPDLFCSIQQAVKEGKWELLGGMWIEPDTNIPSGESLIRQLLYGQRYLQAKFGFTTKVAWLPDTFGFTWQLPQILSQAGIQYFVTGKLHWNDTNKFPHSHFWWESPDGTRLESFMLPPNVLGVMDTQPIPMMKYGISWQQETASNQVFWLPGVGDHGGGPSRDMLEVARRWQNSPFFGESRFVRVEEYLQSLNNSNLPVWPDELYLEFHRGCYTTHGRQKRYNRRAEELLYEAELWGTISHILGGDKVQHLLTPLWHQALFNQFHDILPGTSITPVFTRANREWEEVIDGATGIRDEALGYIIKSMGMPAPPNSKAIPLVVFNSLGWSRSHLISLPLQYQDWGVYDLQHQPVATQLCQDCVLMYAQDIPAIGYRLFWLSPNNAHHLSPHVDVVDWVLENDLLKVTLQPDTGEIQSVWDKINERECLAASGNQLQAFEDKGQYWDAWNIDPNYQQHPLDCIKLVSINWIDRGPLQWRVRVVKLVETSEVIQDYVLQKDSPILRINNRVDWLLQNVLLKAAFPLTIKGDVVSYEIACGVCSRSTTPHSDADKAKWEVSGHRWVDMSDGTYGCSILNDCKYGYNATSDQIAITLLRSPKWPDPEADMDVHHFSYGLYPHVGNWQQARSVHHGYEFNIPVIPVIIEGGSSGSLPNVNSFMSLGSDNLVLSAFKVGEDGGLILRCYEAYDETTKMNLNGSLCLSIKGAVDLLECHLSEFHLKVMPYQIKSFAVAN